MPSTYEQFQAEESSRKTGLLIMEASRRLSAWSLYLGSVYRIGLDEQVLVSVTEDGAALSSVASVALLTAGTYYHDRQRGLLYLRTTSSASPDSVFIALTFRLFFSNMPVNAPHDMDGARTGFDVEWLPLLEDSSEFTVAVENTKTSLGIAISSTSSIKLKNDRDFWDSIFDKLTFQSKRVFVWSWSKSLPVSEAVLYYKGFVEKRTHSAQYVTFQVKDFLDELRAPVQVTSLRSYSGAVIPENLYPSYQRRLYGYVRGHVPTPIDQVLPTEGWALTGTLSVAAGATTITGTGTAFLAELSPGDDVRIGTAKKVRVESVTSDTAFTIAEAFAEASQTAVTGKLFPSHPKRYANRVFLVAGHALARPAVTVTSFVDNANIFVDSTEELLEGDPIEYDGFQTTIRVLGDAFFKLTDALTSPLTVAAVIYRSSISNVYLNGDLLRLTRDYTYDAETALITLTDTAEFNIAPPRALTGTAAFTNGLRTVVGTGTQFNTELSKGDWIKGPSSSTYFEILEIVDETNLILRTASDATQSGACLYKAPKVYDTGAVLSCDALGKKDADGNFMRYAGSIAKDLLIDAGLSSSIEEASFSEVDDLLPHPIGFAIPLKYADRKSPPLRDVLTRVCRSIFASIKLNADYQLEMIPLEPSFVDTPLEITEKEAVEINVASDSSELVAAANVTYDVREYDPASAGPLSRVERGENNLFLFQTEKELDVDTYLIDEDDALAMASRWAFILSIANSDVRFSTKMQAATLEVFSIVKINHNKLYERFGSEGRVRIGAIVSSRKRLGGVELLVNDLGGAFSRCARIAPEGTSDFQDSSEDEKLLYGHMTDENGLTDGLSGINLIW